MRGVAPGLPDPEAFELEWSSSSSEESPAYATKPVFILFTAGSTEPCSALLSSNLGLTPFTGSRGGGISCRLSLSLGGPEELGGGGPVVSGLPTEKPAPGIRVSRCRFRLTPP